MNRVRSVLDRLNDLEGAIVRLDAEAEDKTSLGYTLTRDSLEQRREVLKQELDDATKESFVEVCDYRIIPQDALGYSISAISGALKDFQELLTLVFDAITDRPKQKASYDPDLIEKTRLDFGFSYSGSVGIALVIRNDRELFDSNLDKAISAVFEIIQSSSSEEIHEAAAKYGRPTVRKLYHWSKLHSDYGLAVDIKWLRESAIRTSVLAQPEELANICEIIESKSEPYIEPVTMIGTLVSWDTIHRRFIIDVPGADPIGGKIAKDVDVARRRVVRVRYEFQLQKETHTDYSLDQEKTVWILTDLKEPNSTDE